MSVLDFIVEKDIPNALARAAAAHTGPVDHHWYEPRWDERLQRLVELVQSGETSLPRVVAYVSGAPEGDALSGGHDFIWLGERVFAYPLLMAAQRRSLFNSVLRQACRPDTDSVVELGAGDGLISLCILARVRTAAGPLQGVRDHQHRKALHGTARKARAGDASFGA